MPEQGAATECGQLLYEDGELVARCTRPYGKEHSHHDHSALEQVALGFAQFPRRRTGFWLNQAVGTLAAALHPKGGRVS